MRLLTLLNITVGLLAFSIYFSIIEPYVQHERWLAFLIFFFIWMTLSYFSRKVEALHIDFLEKRLDKMLSLLIICSLFTVFLVIMQSF